jgi:pimeloyl-ACP methyl ester carboxylesterase
MLFTEHRVHIAGDQTPIAYDLAGPPDAPALLLCDGIGCDGFIWRHLVRDLSPRYRLVHPHYRGHGRSQAPADPSRLSIADLCRDLHGILDQEGVERCVALGHSMGVQVILELARRERGRVAGLVPLCGSYGRPLDAFADSNLVMSFLPGLLGFSQRFPESVTRVWGIVARSPLRWYMASLLEAHSSMARSEDVAPCVDHVARMNPSVFFKMLKGASRHTALPFLRELDVPSLVVAGERDRFTPMRQAEKMARLLPLARLVRVRGGSHVAPLECPDFINGEIASFLHAVGWALPERALAQSSSSSKKMVSRPAM